MTQNKINIDTIKYLENLMKINIDDTKRQRFVIELGDIVSHFDELKDIDFDNIDQVIGFNKNTMREDIILNTEGDHKNLSLKNASDTLADYYKVAQVIKQ